VSPLLGNELPVPTKDGVGSDDRRHRDERPSSDGFTPNREFAALVVGQSESSATELSPKNSVLLSGVFDECVLMVADPAG